MNYYYFNNQINNNQFISHNPYQQQNYLKNMRNPQFNQQQYPRYNQYQTNNMNYNRNINPYNNMYGNKVFQQQQSETDELSIIQSLKYVSEKYPHLITLNQINTGILNKVGNQVSPRFFVIKSFTEEDIHKVTNTLKIVN